MSNSRDEFLQAVRRAVAEGNRPGSGALPERGPIGYQGGGRDPVTRFVEALTRAGGKVYVVRDENGILGKLSELVRGTGARRILLGRSPLLDRLPLQEHLTALGLEVTRVDTLSPTTSRDSCFAAEVGISGVHALVAETGSLVIEARPDEPRSLSLLPLVHLAVAERRQLVPDLFDLFERADPMPSCLTLITGPSKTGDIELRLVTGVHGPGELHVILLDPASGAS
jgi:L-lactate utilization protein LutC